LQGVMMGEWGCGRKGAGGKERRAGSEGRRFSFTWLSMIRKDSETSKEVSPAI
jgi:hypothetical protein